MRSCVVVEAGDDEQDGVGAGDDAFVDLEFVEDEVLAQERELDLLADLAQVGEVALEIFLVGEDAEACAPPRAYSRACESGLKSAAMMPAEGEAFFTSAMTAMSLPRCSAGAEGAKIVAQQRLPAQLGGVRLEALDLLALLALISASLFIGRWGA